MASATTEPNGHKIIQVKVPSEKNPKGKRVSIRLGPMEDGDVAKVKEHVEHLAECLFRSKPPCLATDRWASELLDDPTLLWLYDRIAGVGLLTERLTPDDAGKPKPADRLRLGAFLQDYFDRRPDVKQSTRTNWAHTKRNLLEFFGEDRRIHQITVADAKDFERFLKTTAREMRYGDAEKASGLKPPTVRKRVGNAKQFFHDALERELIGRNPFSKLKSGSQANRSRDFFITFEMAQQVLDSCPDAQWRLLFALSRFGGLRCPSEHLLLTWQDVDWDRGRLTVHSPKTEHHEGKASRIIPLFPELRKYLEEVWAQVEGQLAADAQEFGTAPGSAYVITRYRNPNQNLRTTLEKIIRRAGFEPWPKLWQNLRASCETELMQRFPAHVVVAWIGHTEAIARKHYLQVTDADFESALEAVHGSGARNAVQGPNAVQKAVHASDPKKRENPGKNRGSVAFSATKPVGDKGLEPSTSAL